jgi:hypothetical protein
VIGLDKAFAAHQERTPGPRQVAGPLPRLPLGPDTLRRNLRGAGIDPSVEVRVEAFTGGSGTVSSAVLSKAEIEIPRQPKVDLPDVSNKVSATLDGHPICRSTLSGRLL